MQPRSNQAWPNSLVQQRHELAEVRRPLDGRAGEAQALGHGVVVDRDVAVVRLGREHLPWPAELAAQRVRGFEGLGQGAGSERLGPR
jgi:hypothetical protein